MNSEYLDKYTLITGASTEILRTVCKPIKSINHEIKQFAKLLKLRMDENDGVGIAAPQVGRPIRMAAFATLDTGGDDRDIIDVEVMINPKVVSVSKQIEIDTEWCLSLPWEEWDVARPIRATIQWTTPKGNKVTRKVEWFNARVMLHEIDHLDGILFIDKLA